MAPAPELIGVVCPSLLGAVSRGLSFSGLWDVVKVNWGLVQCPERLGRLVACEVLLLLVKGSLLCQNYFHLASGECWLGGWDNAGIFKLFF